MATKQKRTKIRVKVYASGKVVTEPCFQTIPCGSTWCVDRENNKGSYLRIICYKDKKDYHIRKALASMVRDCDKSIAAIEKRKKKLTKALSKYEEPKEELKDGREIDSILDSMFGRESGLVEEDLQ